ncbi:hypothetical protein FACS189483_07000 [Spirochaetia bacterium]|nr:hypothetical protein FACS189483_07000 [Spirochaetia bacterium]
MTKYTLRSSIGAPTLAIALAATLALAGCSPGITAFNITAPPTEVDTGDRTGDGDYGPTKIPRIEIYWDDEGVNRAGQELSWPYDSSFGASHPESSRQIGGRIFNAPVGFDYLEWTIIRQWTEPGPSAVEAVEIETVRLPPGFADRSTTSVPSWRSLPLPNGSSFALVAGAVAGTARIEVRNANRDGAYGTFSAYFDIRVPERL